MKKLFILLAIIISTTYIPLRCGAQSQELQQLILDIQKLSELKSILSEMYNGYQILTEGYNTIRDLSQGNFNLHKLFLDGLLSVSPTVRQYKKIADIITTQATILKEYKAAYSQFKGANILSATELNYVSDVYSNLFDKSSKNLDELLMIITDNQLRMNDAERINAIDRLYTDMQDKLSFLRHFNTNTNILQLQRQQSLQEIQSIQQLYK